MSVTMSEFVKAGGMKTLLEHAVVLNIGEVTADPSHSGNFYVDIRFRFDTAVNAPFFGEKDLSDSSRADTSGESPAPQKMVSILSEEAGPASTDVEILNGPASYDRVAPASESYSDDWHSMRGSGPDNLEMEALQEAVYMPDAIWIKRTQALSSILKDQEADKAAVEDVPASVTAVRGAVPAFILRDGSADSSRGDEGSMDNEFAMFTPSTASALDVTPAQEGENAPEDASSRETHQESVCREQNLRKILSDPGISSKLDAAFFDKITSKKKSCDDEKIGEDGTTRAPNGAGKDHSPVDDEGLPKGCGLLRTSSLKAAVKTIRRSFSRDRKSEKATEDQNGTDSGVHSARANNSASHTELHSDGEIQPDHGAPNLALAADINPDPSVPREDVKRKERTGDRNAKPGGNLLRKTSNLARNLFRKLSSNDPKESDRRAAATGAGDANEDPIRLGKRGSLFRKRSASDEGAAKQAGVTTDGNTVPNEGQSNVIKRRSLIFGRRYKE